jgi:2-keto-4-pentenoate hydratase/2-oxohepta-3-ene-1,7-dioic acid hydratase in catechol pathway
MLQPITRIFIFAQLALLCGYNLSAAEQFARQHTDRFILFESRHSEGSRFCLGQVIADTDGIPTQVQRISDQFCVAQRRQLSQRLMLDWLSRAQVSGSRQDQPLEALAEAELAQRVLSAMPVTQSELDSEAVYIIGVGLNYAAHREEVGSNAAAGDWEDLLFFSKAVPPIGPYGSIQRGLRLGKDSAEDVILLDYEIELGFVLLQPIDLNQAIPEQAIYQHLAYFAANDYSDREPIILDSTFGYSQGKTQPDYLPIGPWLVPASQLPKVFNTDGERGLAIKLSVDDGADRSQRQDSSTLNMLHEPRDILVALRQHYLTGTRLCRRDAVGQHRYFYREDGMLPEGTIFLTGTPSGVAIHPPPWYEKLALLFKGGFSIKGASSAYVEDLQEHALEDGFLTTGHRVTSTIEALGRQRHQIVDTRERTPYGVLLENADCSYPLE